MRWGSSATAPRLGRRSWSSLAAISVVLVLSLSVVPSSAASRARLAAQATARLFPSSGALFGSWVAPRAGETTQGAIERVEAQIGRTFAIDHQYAKWDTAFPTPHVVWSADAGRIPFVNWKPITRSGQPIAWSSIASGSQDAWIATQADALKAFGVPMYLAFHHEPEDDTATFGSAADYAAATRRVVDVFRSRDVTNVAFVWNMMSWSFDPRSGRDLSAWYPGDAYVDAVGTDGYSWYPMKAGAPWESFEQIFAPTHDFAVAHGKPVMVVEYGAQEDPNVAGRKAQWIRDVVQTVQGWPEFKALIYFDELKDGYPWTTDTSVSSMQAYREIAQDPYLDPDDDATPTPTPVDAVTNGFEGGIAGSAVVPHVFDGGDATAFDAVTATKGSSITFDGTHARGSTSAKHVLTRSGNAFYAWSDAFGRQRSWYGRVHVWFDAAPAGDLRLVRARGDGKLRFAMDLLRTGKLRVKDGRGRTVLSTTQPIATGRWVRVEWHVDHVSGAFELRVFDDASTTPNEVVTSTNGWSFGAFADRYQFGRAGTQPFRATFWTDDAGLATNDWLGPASS